MDDFEKEKKRYQSFVAAGQNQHTWSVFATLLATILGASTTLGVAARAEHQGFFAFCWLAAGGVGLALQGLFLSQKIRNFSVKTLPELAQVTIGNGAQRIVAWVIAVSWPGIIAAQFVAMADILNAGLGFGNVFLWIPLLGLLVTFFTMLGGQRLVVQSDRIFLIILLVGFLSLFSWVFHQSPLQEFHLIASQNLFLEKIQPTDFFSLVFLVGGAYFLGPDVTSRTFVARNGRTARRAVLFAAPVLILFGALISFVGVWTASHLPGETNPLLRIAWHLPPVSLAFFSIGLYAALISSVNTCLVNAATIISSDLLGKQSISITRFFIALLGVLGIAMALWQREIINLLLVAYSVYTPGIVVPLTMAILSPGKCLSMKLWIAIASIGGCLGITFSLGLIPDYIPALWMFFSFFIIRFFQIKFPRYSQNETNVQRK